MLYTAPDCTALVLLGVGCESSVTTLMIFPAHAVPLYKQIPMEPLGTGDVMPKPVKPAGAITHTRFDGVPE
jgi:hypothetical protein